MSLRGFLDRERRLAQVSVLYGVARESSQMWFRHYRRSLTQRHALTAQLAEADEIIIEEQRRSERYWLAWLNARRRASSFRNSRDEIKDLQRRLDAATQNLQIQRTEHFDEVKRIQDERQRWERMAEQAIVPAPSTPLRPDDRAGLYRLEQENERLRKLLDDERAAHDRTRAEHVEFIQLRHNPLLDEYLTERAQLIDKLAKYEGATP